MAFNLFAHLPMLVCLKDHERPGFLQSVILIFIFSTNAMEDEVIRVFKYVCDTSAGFTRDRPALTACMAY